MGELGLNGPDAMVPDAYARASGTKTIAWTGLNGQVNYPMTNNTCLNLKRGATSHRFPPQEDH